MATSRIKRVPILRRPGKRKEGMQAKVSATSRNAGQGKLEPPATCRTEELADANRDTLGSVCRQICAAHSVPHTPSLMTDLCRFYDQRLKKLEYLNDRMIHIYASAFIYRNSRNLKKEVFAKGIKKEIFGKALMEIDDWIKVQEPVDVEDDSVCNLYSIMDRQDSQL